MSMGNEQFQSEEEMFAAAPSFDGAEQGQEQPQEQPAPQAGSPEPFEGFSALPEAVRQHWTKAEEQRKQYETDLAQARREVGALKGKVPVLERELATLRKPKPATAPASASAAPVSAEAWEAFKAAFPEDAKAIEQRQAAFAAEFSGKLSPIEQQLKDQAERLERFEQQAWEAETEAIREHMSELVPDWKLIAGVEDRDGNEIAADQQEVAPEFRAWMEALPKAVASSYGAALNSRDPQEMAFVLNLFKRDYYLALLEEESASPQQSKPAPRTAALRDVMPSASGSALQSGYGQRATTHEERAFVEATTSDLMRQWREAKVG